MSQFSTAQIAQGQGVPGGAREDLSDIIHNIDPTETPVLTAAGSTTASGVLHEWLTDVLDTPGQNATAEGDEPTFAVNGVAPVRLGNYTQIGSKIVRVTGTTERIDKAGRDSEMAYQSAIKARSLKNDVDYSISATNVGKSAGSGDDPTRISASLMVWLGENAVGVPTTPTALTPPALDGNGNVDGVDNWGAGAPSTLLGGTNVGLMTPANLDLAIENAWENGGKPTLIVAGPTNKAHISTFDGVGAAGLTQTDRQNTRSDRAGRTIYATADVYVSNFGTLNVVPSRHVKATGTASDGFDVAETNDSKVFLIDPEYLKIAYLRPWQQFDLAKVGDSIRREMLVEWTLEVCNPRAHSAVIMGEDGA